MFPGRLSLGALLNSVKERESHKRRKRRPVRLNRLLRRTGRCLLPFFLGSGLNLKFFDDLGGPSVLSRSLEKVLGQGSQLLLGLEGRLVLGKQLLEGLLGTDTLVVHLEKLVAQAETHHCHQDL